MGFKIGQLSSDESGEKKWYNNWHHETQLTRKLVKTPTKKTFNFGNACILFLQSTYYTAVDSLFSRVYNCKVSGANLTSFLSGCLSNGLLLSLIISHNFVSFFNVIIFLPYLLISILKYSFIVIVLLLFYYCFIIVKIRQNLAKGKSWRPLSFANKVNHARQSW